MVVFDADYCPHCGASLADAGDGHYECPSCDRAVYRNVVPAASVAVVREDGGVLCIQRGHPPAEGEWSLPAGHIEPGERPALAAARELAEEAGLEVDPDALTLACAQQLPTHGGKHMVSIDYAVRSGEVNGTPSAGSDAVDVAWLTRDALPASSPPQAHRRVDAALAALAGDSAE